MIYITYRHVCRLCDRVMGEENYAMQANDVMPMPGKYGRQYLGDYLCEGCYRPMDEAYTKRWKEIKGGA